jgi:hypothetical protein
MIETSGESNRLTETLEERLSHPATSPDFDLKNGVNEVLADVGMTSDDCGGELSFYGSDPILQSPLRFGTMAAIGLAARSVAVAALWRQATGEGQNISVDVRKALRRFCGFFEGKWETVNGRPPSPGGASAHSEWVMSSRGARWEETWLYTGRTCSTSGGPAILRSKPSPGMSRSECVQRYWTIRRRIAHGSINFSRRPMYSLLISAQDF